MTELMPYIPGLSDDEKRTVGLLFERLARTSPRNQLRTNIYDGKRRIQEVSSVIPPQYANMAFALGWGAKGVDGLARRVNLDGFTWADGDLDSLGLPELLDSNFLLSELSQGRTDSLIHGTSFLVTTQGEDGEPKALVHARDALHATGEWNRRARRLDSFLSLTDWDAQGDLSGFALYFDGYTVVAKRDGWKWEIDRSEHQWGMPAEPLIYRPRSSRVFGKSRITRPVISLYDMALRALPRLESHMDVYAIPQMILLGASSSIFKNADGTTKAEWQIATGRVFGIPDDEDAVNPRAEVEHIQAQSPQPHLAELNALAKLMARETDLPDSDFALTDMANPTSEGSYYAGRENLIAEAEGAMLDWSVPIRRTVQRALAIQNGTTIDEAWRSIQPEWRSPVHLSKAAEADAGAKIIGSVPWLAETRVGLKKLGLSAQEIDLALSERAQAEGRALLTALAGTTPEPVAEVDDATANSGS